MNVWRDRLSRWLDPLARRSPLSANAITVLALLFNMVAAWGLTQGRHEPVIFLAATALLIIGGVADAFDGIVARAKGTTSRFGDFLDHVADRVSDTLLALGWVIGNDIRQPLIYATIILVMLNGYVGTQIEATYRERNYDSVGRGEFVLGLVVYPIVSFILYSNGWATLRMATLTIGEWMTLLLLAMAIFGLVQRFMLARRLDRS